MNVARADYSVTDYIEWFCIVGGTSNGQASTSVELYEPDADKWRRLAHINTPRSYFQLINLDHFLYGLGGNVMEKYDPLRKCSKEVRALNCNYRPNTKTPLTRNLHSRFNHSGAAILSRAQLMSMRNSSY